MSSRVLKRTVSFPLLDEETGENTNDHLENSNARTVNRNMGSDSNIDVSLGTHKSSDSMFNESPDNNDEQEIVAISFTPNKNKSKITVEFDIQKMLLKWFNTNETNLTELIENGLKELNFCHQEIMEKHLKRLKILGNKLYNNNSKDLKLLDSKFNINFDERSYLWFMTTITKGLSELDGIILRHYYLENFTWKSDLLMSLRILCSRLFFKGESQNIDIMIHSFANNWFTRYDQPSFIYGNIVGVYLVTYSLILLNTDLHADDHLSQLNESFNSTANNLIGSSNNTNNSVSHSSPRTPSNLSSNGQNNSIKNSGSFYELFSHETHSTVADSSTELSAKKSSYSKTHDCISKNQFVLNTLAAINDNFVVVNPLIMRKQLRLYYTNIKNYELKLPNLSISHKTDMTNTSYIKNELMTEPIDHKADKEINEDPNDVLVDLTENSSYSRDTSRIERFSTNESYLSIQTKLSFISFEIVSGKYKDTEGKFGFLKEIESTDESTNRNDFALSKDAVIVNPEKALPTIETKIKGVPYIKEGLQKVICKEHVHLNLTDVYDSSNFIFKDIPTRKAKGRLFNRIIGRKSFHMYEELFIVISDGEMRIFDFNKSHNCVNADEIDHGRGEWTKFAKCLGIVNLSGCYAEFIGKNSRRRISKYEKLKMDSLLGREDKFYWKLELPYTNMNDTIGTESRKNEHNNKSPLDKYETNSAHKSKPMGLSNSQEEASYYDGINNAKKYNVYDQINEKLIFVANTLETAEEFVNTCNYWASLTTPIPPANIFNIFGDDEDKLTSEEYGFSSEVQSALDHTLYQKRDKSHLKRFGIVDWFPPIQPISRYPMTTVPKITELREHIIVVHSLLKEAHTRYLRHKLHNERRVVVFALREVLRWRAYYKVRNSLLTETEGK